MPLQPMIIPTRRLRLLPPPIADAKDVFRNYARDPDVTRYVTWRPHARLDETIAFMERCIEGWRSETELTWVVTLSTRDEALGMVSASLRGHRANIGYVLAKSHWGCSYMTEAVHGVVDWLFRRPTIYRVWAFCDVENAASARVMQKAGMTCEGTLRRWAVHPNVSDDPRDCFVFAKVR